MARTSPIASDDALRERAERLAEQTQSTSIAVLRSGEFVVDCSRPLPASGSWAVLQPEPVLEPEPPPALGLAFERMTNGRMRQDIASAHKSIVSMLVACARDRDLLTLEDSATQYLGEAWSRAPREVEATITLRHLLTMTSGLSNGLELEDPPGTRWNYTLGPAWHLLKRVLPVAAGIGLAELSQEWLFGPLGLTDTVWDLRPGMTYPDGEPVEVLLSHAADLVRLGQLVLHDGRSGDRQLISTTATRDMITQSQPLNPAYGLLWWLNASAGVQLPSTAQSDGRLAPHAPADAVAMLGALGQICLVVPSHDLVIARVGGPSGGPDALIGLGLLDDLWRRVVAGP